MTASADQAARGGLQYLEYQGQTVRWQRVRSGTHAWRTST
jgi:hypothetical protein